MLRAAHPRSAEAAQRHPEPYDDATDPPRRPVPPWGWVLAAAVLLAAGLVGAALVPSGTRASLWWPAAGVGVAFALLQPAARIRAALGLVLVVTSVANLMAGRPLDLALVWGVVNALEVAVVVAVVGAWSRPFRIASLRAALRFVLAAVAGGLTAGALAAGAIVLLVDGAFWPTAPFIVASHAAAVVMIAPFAALPRRLPVRAGRAEMLVQAALLGLVIAWTFHPDVALPLAFALNPFLAWAAFRFPIRVVLAEILVASLAMIGLTLAGGGPFSADALDPTMRAALLELFVITLAGFAVVLTAAQHELRAVSRRLDASVLLLGGSLVDARIGLAIAERGCPGARVIWTNPAARRLLAPELGEGGAWSGRLADAAARALAGEEQSTVTAVDGRTITVVANAIVGDEARFAVQLLDVTAIVREEHDRVEAEVERESARAIRAELERQRDDFLAATSHELRTPITSILGYAELLADADCLPESQRAWVTAIERNAHRLAELAEDVLTLSGGAKAPSRHRPERIRCGALCDEVVASLRLDSDAKRLEVTVDVRDAAVMGARADVVRALSNLLLNAIRFTPVGGRIRITAREAGPTPGGMVLLSIADTGPGMGEDEIARAFERFYRAPAAELGNVPGAGLGLPIVAELARRNGGHAGLRSNDDGGLTAELRLVAAGPE